MIQCLPRFPPGEGNRRQPVLPVLLAHDPGHFDRAEPVAQDAERRTRSDRLQLLGIAEKNQLAAARLDRLRHRGHVPRSDHARLVENENKPAVLRPSRPSAVAASRQPYGCGCSERTSRRPPVRTERPPGPQSPGPPGLPPPPGACGSCRYRPSRSPAPGASPHPRSLPPPGAVPHSGPAHPVNRPAFPLPEKTGRPRGSRPRKPPPAPVAGAASNSRLRHRTRTGPPAPEGRTERLSLHTPRRQPRFANGRRPRASSTRTGRVKTS